jgi:polysaccharide export outer membrane protein
MANVGLRTLFPCIYGMAFVASLLVSIQHSSAAQFTPTPEQIEQFKKLPPEEQKRLAESMGVKLPAAPSPSFSSGEDADEIKTPVLPRSAQQVEGRSDAALQHQVTPSETSDFGTAQIKSRKDLKPYGYDLFSGQPTSFAPIMDIPVPAEYVVGPGDTVVIQLFGGDNQSHQLTVNRQGVIQFPAIGPIPVSGLKFEDVRSSLLQRIKKQMLSPLLFYPAKYAGFIINFFANLSPMFCSRVWCFWVGGFEEIEFHFRKPPDKR